MYFKYGAYQHPDDEVNLTNFEFIPIRNAQGSRIAHKIRMQVVGEIKAVGQAAINTAINTLINAYALDGFDFGLYHDDNTATHHFIDSSASTTGTRIIQRSWPRSIGAEYATQRTFSITVEADFDDVQSPPGQNAEIVSFHERLTFIGNGGQDFEIVDGIFGPIKNITHNSTAQRIVQQGRGVGYTAYLNPALHTPLFPADQHHSRDQYELGSPENQGNVFRNYPSSWRYEFSRLLPGAGVPHAH